MLWSFGLLSLASYNHVTAIPPRVKEVSGIQTREQPLSHVMYGNPPVLVKNSVQLKSFFLGAGNFS